MRGGGKTPQAEENSVENVELSESSSEREESSEIGDDVLQEFQKSATIEETVLFDENGVLITATELNYTDYSADLSLRIENNSDKDLSFISGSLGYSCNSINGYMIDDGYLNCDVAAGKTANDIISFNYESMAIYGIFEIADIEIGIDITDSDYDDEMHTGPCQVKTTAADSYDYSLSSYRESIISKTTQNVMEYNMEYFSDEPLYEQNGLTIASSGIITTSDEDKGILLEVTNSSDDFIYVATSNIYINGLGVYDSSATYDAINPGKTRIVAMDLANVMDNSCWESYGITDIGTVSLTVGFEDSNGNEYASPSNITITNPNVSAEFDTAGQEIYNNNGIKISVKEEIVEESGTDSEDIFIPLLIENNSGKTIIINDVYGSVSVNNIMTDYMWNSVTVNEGEYGTMILSLQRNSLEENGIMTVSDISNVEVEVEISEDYDVLDDVKLNMTF